MSGNPSTNETSETAYNLTGDKGGEAALAFSGPLDKEAYDRLHGPLLKELSRKKPGALTMDLSAVTRVDDMGVLLLARAREAVRRSGGTCQSVETSDKVREVLGIYDLDALCEVPEIGPKPLQNPVTSLGDSVLKLLYDTRGAVEFTGSVALSVVEGITRPWSVRWDDTLYAMRRVGVDAVPIVGVISFLLGFIIAFMSQAQLAGFGASIFVPSLVGLAMVRELGPIMTAIIMAGRSGSAFASEIGTMKINEEVDALYTMGFDPQLFLVVPKMFASVVVMPFLTLFSCLFGIFGGLVVGIFIMDLTFDSYIQQTIKYLHMQHLLWVLIKSVTFGILVTWTGCLRGFQVKGGATGVGDAATSAVVTSIFLVIFWDSIFAFIQLYWYGTMGGM